MRTFFHRNVKANGVVPQLSLIMGVLCRWSSLLICINRLHFMVEGRLTCLLLGHNVVKTVTHREVTSEELGGAKTHATKSGVTHFTAAHEAMAIEQAKTILNFLPQNCKRIL